MRIGEAIALDLDDFAPDLGVVVVHGKLGKIRELPLAPSTSEAISAYVQRRDRPPGRVPTRALFVGIWGTRLEPSRVASTILLVAGACRDRAAVRVPADDARAAAHVRDPHDARRLPARP
ncbi:MAG: hypothetical protein JO168_10925 [Solirubrobacterales bacterium]|nr:hypothetical protein [Solirubrobacterales bacterium]